MSSIEPNEQILLGLKRIELDAMNLMLGLPFPESELFKLLDWTEWRYRMMVDLANELAQKAKNAYTAIHEGKIMTNTKLRDEMAKEFLSQFCISPGTPHWLAGERDFKAGWHAAETELENKLSNLNEKLRVAREALEFYAIGFPGPTGNYAEHIEKQLAEVDANIAREALAKIKEGE